MQNMIKTSIATEAETADKHSNAFGILWVRVTIFAAKSCCTSTISMTTS